MVYQRDSVPYGKLPNLRLGSEFDEVSAHVETLWLQLRRGRLQQPQYRPPVARPAVDVYQTPDAVVVVVEAPGMRDQEIRLEIEAGRLTIWGEKRNRYCREAYRYHQLEIACGAFSRTVDLPAEVDPERVTLRYDDGYVEINLPRVEHAKDRRVRMTLRQP